MRELKKYRVNIPAGVKDGSRIRLAGKGEAGLRGGPAGDLFVITHVSESPVFQRKGDNFEVEVPITVAEALGGADVEVPTLHGHEEAARAARARSTARSSACAARARRCRARSGKGDLHYRFVIDVPGELSDEQRRAVDELSKVMNGNPRERILREAGQGRLMGRPRKHPVTARVEYDRGVFMISVAAELAEMHPQTLRMYEARGLIEPKRSPKGTRLYSHADVERLRRIQELTSDGGHEPRRRGEGVRARGRARADAAQGRRARAPRRRARGRDRAARGGQALGQGRDRPLRGASRPTSCRCASGAAARAR